MSMSVCISQVSIRFRGVCIDNVSMATLGVVPTECRFGAREWDGHCEARGESVVCSWIVQSGVADCGAKKARRTRFWWESGVKEVPRGARWEVCYSKDSGMPDPDCSRTRKRKLSEGQPSAAPHLLLPQQQQPMPSLATTTAHTQAVSFFISLFDIDSSSFSHTCLSRISMRKRSPRHEVVELVACMLCVWVTWLCVICALQTWCMER